MCNIILLHFIHYVNIVVGKNFKCAIKKVVECKKPFQTKPCNCHGWKTAKLKSFYLSTFRKKDFRSKGIRFRGRLPDTILGYTSPYYVLSLRFFVMDSTYMKALSLRIDFDAYLWQLELTWYCEWRCAGPRCAGVRTLLPLNHGGRIGQAALPI